jgi:hypothetical protein
MKIGVTVEGVERLDRAAAGVQRDLREPAPMIEEVVDAQFYPIMQEAFDTEGHGRWRRASPGYARLKRRLYGDKPIMQATGGLMRSLTQKGAPGNLQRRVGPDAVEISSTLPHAGHATRERPIELRAEDVERLGDGMREEMKHRGEGHGFEAE